MSEKLYIYGDGNKIVTIDLIKETEKSFFVDCGEHGYHIGHRTRINKETTLPIGRTFDEVKNKVVKDLRERIMITERKLEAIRLELFGVELLSEEGGES